MSNLIEFSSRSNKLSVKLKQAEREARNLFAAICAVLDVMPTTDADREWMCSMLRDAQALSGNIEHVIECGVDDNE